MSKELLAYIRKALVAGALAAIAALLAYNIPGWISGDEAFDWRSVIAALVSAFIAGVVTYRVRNGPPPGLEDVAAVQPAGPVDAPKSEET